MKNIVLSLLVVFSIGSSVTQASSQSAEVEKKQTGLDKFNALGWQTELAKAFQLAKSEHKNVIVMVEDTRCKWCVKMKKEALSDSGVQAILKNYVLVKVQRSDKATVANLEGFDGNIPHFFFMKNDKEIVENIVGYFETEDFLGYIKEIEEDGF